MLPKKKNGQFATELKDLDVDRIDGVDKPATGRGFVVSKGAFRLFPASVSKAAEDPFIMKMREAVEKNVRECLIKRINNVGDLVDWKVAGEDGFALFKTQDEAVEFIAKCTLGPMLKAYYDDKLGTPNGMGSGAMDNEHPSQRMADQMRGPNFPGSVQAPMGERPDSLLDADFDHLGNPKPKRKSLMELHEASMRLRGRSNVAGRKIFLN